MRTVRDIQPKAMRCKGTVYQGKTDGEYNADIEPGKSIRIYGREDNRYVKNPETGKMEPGSVTFDLTFKIGDGMAYDSYNLIYTGTVEKITAKTVSIRCDCGGRLRRLDLHTFILRNWNYDAKRIAEHNAAEMQCI